MRIFFVALIMAIAMSGCAELPLNKDGQLMVGKDTTARVDGIGAGHLSNKF